ncbi:MAG: glycosyltransferase [Candidatus Helarchaeota archaeon]
MISLIITTYNEANSIENLLQDILEQSKLPSELVIVDAGSQDNTINIIKNKIEEFKLKKINVKLIISPGANISQGRNIAIKNSSHNIIAVTDAGSRLDKNWLELITLPLKNNKADFVGGFYLPVTHSRFQQILAVLTTAPYPKKSFLPSSRSVAFRKEYWEKVGGYPEDIPWGEDTAFNKRMLKSGARYIIADRAIVYWEVRKNLKQTIKQYFRYALGDGLAKNFSVSHSLNLIIYFFIFSLILLQKYLLALFFFISYNMIRICSKKKYLKFKDILPAFLISTIIHFVRFLGFVYGLIKGKTKAFL